MDLHEDVLQLVKEYSMPVTRPDWKNIHRMKELLFIREIAYIYNMKNKNVIRKFVDIYENTDNTKYVYFRYSYTLSKPIAYIFPNPNYKM
jgi:hypothetical protein